MYGQQNLRDMLTQMGQQQPPQMVDQGGGGGFQAAPLPAMPQGAPGGGGDSGGVGGDMGGILQMIMSLFGG